MSKQSIIAKGKAFTESVSRTVVESALDVANAFWNEYGADASKDDVSELAVGIGGKVPARVSEWRSFFNAVPFGLIEALNDYPAGNLTRVKLFNLARNCIKTGDYAKYKSAIKATEKPAAKEAKTPDQKLGMAIGIIKNLDTRKKSLIEFRKELAKLCAKHGVSY